MNAQTSIIIKVVKIVFTIMIVILVVLWKIVLKRIIVENFLDREIQMLKYYYAIYKTDLEINE